MTGRMVYWVFIRLQNTAKPLAQRHFNSQPTKQIILTKSSVAVKIRGEASYQKRFRLSIKFLLEKIFIEKASPQMKLSKSDSKRSYN